MLNEDSWLPAVEFLDFVKVMDMEQTAEEEETVGEEKAKVKEDTDSSSGAHTPDNNPAAHSEL